MDAIPAMLGSVSVVTALKEPRQSETFWRKTHTLIATPSLQPLIATLNFNPYRRMLLEVALGFVGSCLGVYAARLLLSQGEENCCDEKENRDLLFTFYTLIALRFLHYAPFSFLIVALVTTVIVRGIPFLT